ncbi:hypothetical protein M5K25_022253 [Dendrobium thyrsiflorum]|uniref:Uncharacterized protein n=1 Tax=Dendrobium thyrsiflorum TaxID=117978 RepID=A0ABD0U5Y2_DENTH
MEKLIERNWHHRDQRQKLLAKLTFSKLRLVFQGCISNIIKEKDYKLSIESHSSFNKKTMAAKKVDALEERLEGEMNQIKTTVEERMSSMEGQVADLRDMIKKMLEVHNQTTASVARNGEGRSTNSEIRKEEEEAEIIEGERRRPHLEPIQREERGELLPYSCSSRTQHAVRKFHKEKEMADREEFVYKRRRANDNRSDKFGRSFNEREEQRRKEEKGVHPRMVLAGEAMYPCTKNGNENGNGYVMGMVVP